MAKAYGYLRLIGAALVLGSSVGASVALEVGIDGAVNSSSILSGWGASSHLQVVHSSQLGIDLGYRYFSDLNYTSKTFGELSQPRLQQYEFGVFRQFGDQGVRWQAIVGPVWSGDAAAIAGNALIDRFDLGFRADIGLSVPVLSSFRAFGEVGYQGWFDAELPNHLRWRYGLRWLFGGQSERAIDRPTAAAGVPDAEIDTDSVVIDGRVPEYIPSYLSESLPPIVEMAEVCKCFPAGPYTLQLGEFSDINQALRALEFRGLRQFFNSRAFERSAQPVFLAQVDDSGATALYLGELPTIEAMEYWRQELRKNGISARMRKVLNNNGERVSNPMMGVEVAIMESEAVYTAEEIRRMNSLPESEYVEQALGSNTIEPLAELDVRALNAVSEAMTSLSEPYERSTIALTIDEWDNTQLLVGPMSFTDLERVLSDQHTQVLLADNANIAVPTRGSLIINETAQEAWLLLTQFHSSNDLDHWRVIFESMSLGVESVELAPRPVGDITRFSLSEPAKDGQVLVIGRAESASRLVAMLRSPEVLWFDAFTRVNRIPVGMSLRWSAAEQAYLLLTEGISSERQQNQIQSYLISVGLLPNVNEAL